MPFPQQEARAFTREGIEWLWPDQQGVYGLFQHDGRCVYVGKAICLRRRLLEHLAGDNRCVVRNWPLYYMAQAVTGDLDVRERELIWEFTPICNIAHTA